jgi:hypothetical protein
MPAPPPSLRRRPRRSRLALLLGAAALRALAVALAGSVVSAGAVDRLTSPALADDGGDGGGDHGGSGGGSGGGSDGGGSGDGGTSGHGGNDDRSDDGGHGSDDESGAKGASSKGGGAALGGASTNGAATGVAANGGSEGSERDDFLPGEVMVLGDRPEVLAGAQSLGFRLIEIRPLAALGFSILKLKTPASADPHEAVALLHARFPGLTADVNTLYGSYAAQSAQVHSLPAADYARRMIRWSGGEGCGAGFRVGMIDSAVAADVPALAGRRLHQRSFLAPGRTAGDPAHGTAIAALLVGGSDPGHPGEGGLLPAADLYAAAIFERHGAESEASALAIAAALDWMVENRVAVLNISLSGEANELMALAVRRAAQRGSVLLAAAGNGGPSGPPGFPAALPEVIAVTAVDRSGAVFEGANRGDYIAFAAPGVRIRAPGPDGLGRYQTGTSFAVPFAAGAAALELMHGAPADAAGLRRRLAAHARALGPAGKNPVYGYGLVQASAACGATASAQ